MKNTPLCDIVQNPYLVLPDL